MRILAALPGLHRIDRGAEVAIESVADGLAALGDDVLLLGSGEARPDTGYRFGHVPAVSRRKLEWLPSVPFLRNELMYEELTFAVGLVLAYRRTMDLTMTCGYPYTNWVLRSRMPGQARPPHVFVTQNGDWPAQSNDREYRFFSCDGLVCTNPEYFERNRNRWFSALIPNGFHTSRFHPGPGERLAFGLPLDRPVVLMVSALTESKRVLAGIEAVATLPDIFLFVAGDGPIRDAVDHLANELLPGRFRRGTVPFDRMPALYRSADVLVHPALAESFGNVYVEALGTGLPVVAHESELTRWILADHAILVDAESPRELSSGVFRALATGKEGVDIRSSFAADRYSWSHIAEEYRRFFADVLSCRG